MMKVSVVGLGYVGLSNAVLLGPKNHVTAIDTVQAKVDAVNDRVSPIVDAELERYLAHERLDLTATTSVNEAYAGADYIVIATPTNYDEETGRFDTSSVDSVIEAATVGLENGSPKNQK